MPKITPSQEFFTDVPVGLRWYMLKCYLLISLHYITHDITDPVFQRVCLFNMNPANINNYNKVWNMSTVNNKDAVLVFSFLILNNS